MNVQYYIAITPLGKAVIMIKGGLIYRSAPRNFKLHGKNVTYLRGRAAAEKWSLVRVPFRTWFCHLKTLNAHHGQPHG